MIEIDIASKTVKIQLRGPGVYTLSLATLERDGHPYLEQRVSVRFV